MNKFEGRTLKPLTAEEIKKLPIEERPNFQGEDFEGKYLVDGYGIKRREGERGGPLPAETAPVKPTRSKKKTIDFLLADKPRWKDPAEILLAIANGDKDYFNRNSRDTKVEDIPLFMRMDAAKQLLPYVYTKPIPVVEEDLSIEKEHKPKVMVILGSNGRELDKPQEIGYDGKNIPQEED
jgi:hypothetical protein